MVQSIKVFQLKWKQQALKLDCYCFVTETLILSKRTFCLKRDLEA